MWRASRARDSSSRVARRTNALEQERNTVLCCTLGRVRQVIDFDIAGTVCINRGIVAVDRRWLGAGPGRPCHTHSSMDSPQDTWFPLPPMTVATVRRGAYSSTATICSPRCDAKWGSGASMPGQFGWLRPVAIASRPPSLTTGQGWTGPELCTACRPAPAFVASKGVGVEFHQPWGCVVVVPEMGSDPGPKCGEACKKKRA